MSTTKVLRVFLLCVLCISIAPFHFTSATPTKRHSDDEYIAAIVEHVPTSTKNWPPVSRNEAQTVMYHNLYVYEQQIVKAKQKGAQVIVFPEDGLYDANFPNRESMFPYLEEIPNIQPGDKPIPLCTHRTEEKHHPILSTAACMAAKHSMYVVLNMGDLQWCNATTDPYHAQCPSDGRFQFNTQVALSNKGELMAKYHKTHLFRADEVCFNYPPQGSKQLVYFDTDFGVRFGMFICFDIFFQQPAETLRNKLGIENFVFSTYWENDGTVPLITASQIQQAWSRTNNANLLASNIGIGLEDSGSGIFSSGNIIKTIFNNKNNTATETLLVGAVPKKITSQSSSDTERAALKQIFRREQSPDPSSIHKFKATGSGSLTASSGSVECHLEYNVAIPSSQTPETFGLMAYDGKWIQGLLEGKTCALVRCPSGNCNDVLDLNTDTQWASVSVTMRGAFLADQWKVLSIAGTQGGQLLPEDQVSVTHHAGEKPVVRLHTKDTHPLTNLVLFAQPPEK